jgi:hypothetical protein
MNGAELAILQDLLTQAGTQTALLQRLVNLTAGGGAGGAGGGGAGGLAGAAASAVGGIRGLGTVATVAGVAARTLSVAFNALSSIVGTAGSMIGSFIGHMVNLGENFVEFTKKAMDGRARLHDFVDVFKDLPVIGKVFSIFSQIAQVGEQYLDLYRRTATVGATFGGSLFDISRMASQAGLGLEQFVNVVTQNSETFAAFGAGNLNVGIEKFTQASGKLLGPGSPYARSIMGLGYTADQAASGLATVMKMQGISSRENLASSDQLAGATHQYLMELDTLAKLTGKRRDQVQREIDEVERDQLWMSFVDSLGTENKKAVMAAVQAAAPFGKAAVDEVKARLRGLDIPVSEAGENLAVFSNGASLNGRALRDSVKAANGDIKKTTDAVLGWLSQSATATGKTLDKFSDAQKASGMLAGMVPDGMLYLSRLLKANGNDLTKVLAQIAKDQKGASDGSAGALGLLEMKFTQFGSKVRELLNIALSPLMDNIIKASDGVFSFIDSMIRSKEFKQVIEGVVNWFETTFANVKKAWGDGKDYKEKFNGVFKVLGDAMAEAWRANKDILINLFGPIISDFWKNDVAPMLAGLMQSVLEFIIDALRRNSAIARLLFGEGNAIKMENAQAEIDKARADMAPLKERLKDPSSRGYESTYNAQINLLEGVVKKNQAIIDEIKSGQAPKTPASATPRATGSLGMTGKLFENWGSGSEATLHGTESVMTPEQLIGMVSGAANSELLNVLRDLNNTNAQLLVQARITADNSRRTYEAVKVLNPDLFQMA